MNASVDPQDWAIAAARAAAAKTDASTSTVVLEVGDVLAITGFFVISSGTNRRQVRAMAEEVEENVVEAGGPKPLRIEGLDDGTWVLIDYGDVIVHLFDAETREFYDIERLWRGEQALFNQIV